MSASQTTGRSRPWLGAVPAAGVDAIEDAPRKDGVRLTITINSALVSDSGKPSSVVMEATASSTLESSFSNQGGSIHFAGLVPQNGPDFTGGSMDLAGTIEWTCGQVVQ